MLVLIVFGLQRWQIQEYAITPGQATNVSPLITVHGLATTAHPDHIDLVDVYLQQLSMLTYLTLHLQRHVAYIPAAWLESPGVPNSELLAQGYQQMVDSKTAATVAALRALGWTIHGQPTGAVLTAVGSGSPAASAGLQVEDRIVQLNDQPIRQRCDVIAALHHIAPHTRVTLTVVQQRFSPTGQLRVGHRVTVHLITQAPPPGTPAQGCPGVAGVDRSLIGVALENGSRYAFPANIAINTSMIGGPSAGLAMTLAIIAHLSQHPITGGHVIAATGTIDANGQVGDVGGVAQKAVAVANAGVHYFFVPVGEAAQARSTAPRSLHIIPVTTLAQVLQALRAMGGAPIAPITTPTKPVFPAFTP